MPAGEDASLPGRLGFIEVGARGGSAPRLGPFQARLDRVLVEPDEQEAARLQEASANGTLYTVIPSALGHIDGDIDLHIAKNPTCTSALPVADEFRRQYGISHHFEAQSIRRVACARYDTLHAKGGLPIPHIIKADVQGFEYEVLLGFGSHLQDCLVIEVEAHFYEVYARQRLFGEVTRFLSAFGFVLRSLSLPRSPLLRGDPHFDGDLVEVDALFSKNRKWVSAQTPQKRAQFASACEVMGISPYLADQVPPALDPAPADGKTGHAAAARRA